MNTTPDRMRELAAKLQYHRQYESGVSHGQEFDAVLFATAAALNELADEQERVHKGLVEIAAGVVRVLDVMTGLAAEIPEAAPAVAAAAACRSALVAMLEHG